MSKKRLKRVMGIQSTTYETQDMDDFIYAEYEKIIKGNEEDYRYVYEDGNTYITKGMHAETYPCVIAHTDTVHDIHKSFEIFNNDDIMFAMNMLTGVQVGVGGDDKVGIYVALEMLRELDVIKVAFFRDEEHGCLGSREANMEWFNNVEFVIQCDRQGYKDVVNTIFSEKLFDKPFSKAIKDIIKRYKRKETSNGGLTDVYQLVENGFDRCVMNLSCGYYRPHSDDEVIVINEVFLTRDMVYEIIVEIGGTVWKNSAYRPYVPYKESKPKGKATNLSDKRSYTDWSERSKDDWWEGDDYRQSRSVWDDDPSIPVHQPLQHGQRRELSCGWCGTDEIYYDVHEDADWCFSCNTYSNQYASQSPPHIIDDDYDHRPTEEEVSLSKSDI